MRKLKANIPSKKLFIVNENGEIFNHLGKALKGKHNPNSKTLRALDFLNLENKRQAMSFQKIVWNTFNAEDPILNSEVILLKDQNQDFPFALSNLKKISRKDNVKFINEIRLRKKEFNKNRE